MPEFGERFESLSRTRAPDLWSQIEGREPGPPIEPSSARRVLVALVAFVLAIAGLGIAAVSFGGSERPAASVATGSVGVANGPIYFRVGGGDGRSQIEAVEPDGSGQRVVFEGEPMRIAQIAWSPDGTKMAFQNPHRRRTGHLRREPRRERRCAHHRGCKRRVAVLVTRRNEDRLLEHEV